LVEGLLAAGWRVVALASDDGHAATIEALGAEFVPILIDSSGTSAIRDARLFADYLRILRRLRPRAFLGFTVKPNVYGSLAAGCSASGQINNISGLGTAFMSPGPLNRLVTRLYRLSLRKSERVFFQNPNDLALFVEKGLVRRHQAALLPGSGIDLQRFQPYGRPRNRRPKVFASCSLDGCCATKAWSNMPKRRGCCARDGLTSNSQSSVLPVVTTARRCRSPKSSVGSARVS
jgi:hypothetical protein